MAEHSALLIPVPGPARVMGDVPCFITGQEDPPSLRKEKTGFHALVESDHTRNRIIEHIFDGRARPVHNPNTTIPDVAYVAIGISEGREPALVHLLHVLRQNSYQITRRMVQTIIEKTNSCPSRQTVRIVSIRDPQPVRIKISSSNGTPTLAI